MPAGEHPAGDRGGGELADRNLRPVAVLAAIAVAVLAGFLAAAPTTPPEPRTPEGLSIERVDEAEMALPPVAAAGWSPPAPGVWGSVPAAPIGSRIRHTMVGLPDGVLVWGGFQQGRPLSNGAVFSLSTGLWDRIPDAPVTDRNHVPLLAGGTLLLFDEERPLSYDLRAGTWQEIPAPPLPQGVGLSEHTIWTGDVAVTLTGRLGREAGPALAYDPRRGAWRELPAPPISFTGGHDLVWDGAALLVLAPTDDDFGYRLPLPADGGSQQPQGGWEPLASPPLPPSEDGAAGARAVTVAAPVHGTGTRVYVWAGLPGDARLLEYAPEVDTWRDLGRPPAGASGQQPRWHDLALAWTGRELLAVTPDAGVVYDPRIRRMWPLPVPAPQVHALAEAAWAGDFLVWWGGAEPHGSLWRPSQPPEGSR